MYRGFPNYAPQDMDYVATEERRAPKRSERVPQTYSLSGWRRFAAFLFAFSPGIAYLIVVLVHAIVQT